MILLYKKAVLALIILEGIGVSEEELGNIRKGILKILNT